MSAGIPGMGIGGLPEAREHLDTKIGHLLTAYLVDGGANVAACERAVDDAIDALVEAARRIPSGDGGTQ